MNLAIVIGRLTKDPEVRKTQNGTSVCTFTLAVDRRFTDRQTGKREADFLNIVVWRDLADLCGKYLAKGRKTSVTGSIQTRSYEAQDGGKRYVTEIIAEQVEFLERAQDAAKGAGQSRGGYLDGEEDDLPF